MSESAARAGRTAAITLAVDTLARHYRYQGAKPDAIATFRDELAALLTTAAEDAERKHAREHDVDIDWQQVAVKLAITEGTHLYRLTTPEANALRDLADAELTRTRTGPEDQP